MTNYNKFDKLANNALIQYQNRVFPTRLAWLVLLYDASKSSREEFRGMTSFELEAYATNRINITRHAITAMMRKCADQGLVEIEYVSIPGQRGYCAYYQLTQRGKGFVESLI